MLFGQLWKRNPTISYRLLPTTFYLPLIHDLFLPACCYATPIVRHSTFFRTTCMKFCKEKIEIILDQIKIINNIVLVRDK
mmetsp:Transcript_19176/g.49136  ORF Transcript_19176/g.49136 Transcript_19176/m.49136 type:complete len:80 (+) Transcript_19176:242-481(+)